MPKHTFKSRVSNQVFGLNILVYDILKLKIKNQFDMDLVLV